MLDTNSMDQLQPDNNALLKVYELNKIEITSRWNHIVASFLRFFFTQILALSTLVIIDYMDLLKGKERLLEIPVPLLFFYLIIFILCIASTFIISIAVLSIITMGLTNYEIEERLRIGELGIEHKAFALQKGKTMVTLLKAIYGAPIFHRSFYFMSGYAGLNSIIIGICVFFLLINVVETRAKLILITIIIVALVALLQIRLIGYLFRAMLPPHEKTITKILSSKLILTKDWF